MKDLTPAAVERVLGFVGYGNLGAPLWFIGLEEGLGGMDDADVAANLIARGMFSETMDLAQSHMMLVEGGRAYDVSRRHRFASVWLWMARFARAIEGALDWQDIVLAKEYVRTRLGRFDGSAFLTYASPIPEKGLYTRQWTDLVLSTGLDVRGLLNRRAARVRALINKYRPSIVICHGTSATRDYQSLLPPMNWRAIPGAPSFLSAKDARGLLRFITPFFGVGQMSFDTARNFVQVIQQAGAVLPPRGSLGEGWHGASQVTAVSARSAVETINEPHGSIPMSGSSEEFSDNTDPASTVRLLDRLVSMGLNNGAFALLHHRRERCERETITGFRSYCVNLQGRFRTSSNRLVHDRLVKVLKGHLAIIGGSASAVDFETLADRAYKAIPPK